MDWTTALPIGISSLALVVSGLTLWRAQFAPFKLLTTAGSMSFRRHAFRSENEEWFLPHFATSLSFTNAGAVAGRILDVRAIVRYPLLPIDDAHEVFRCLGEFDGQKYNKSAHGRLLMIDEARLGDFTPFAVLPKATESKFLIFTTRWDKPVRQKEITVDVEVMTDQAAVWMTVKSWTFRFADAGIWRHVESGAAFTTGGSSNDDSPHGINPPKADPDENLQPS